MAMGVSTHTSPFTSSPFRFSSVARRSFSRPVHPACRRLSGSPRLGNYFRASSDCGGWGAESEKLKLAKMAHQVRDKVASRGVVLHDEFERSKIVTTVERLREGLASGQSQLTGAAERLHHLVPVSDNLANGWDPTAQREKSICVAAFKEGSGYARRSSQIGGGTWDGTVARDHPVQVQSVTLEDIEKTYSGRVGTASDVFNGTDSTVSKSSINREACNEVPREQNSHRQKLRTLINREEWDEMSKEQTSPRKKLSHNGSIPSINGDECNKELMEETSPRQNLSRIFDKVLVVDNISKAREVVQLLTTKYKDLVHACDTEVANIDVKQETPVDHGEIICFSIYSSSQADFGSGKSCIWVDVLDGGRSVLLEFAPFFEDPSIKKVWHNYSFDSHVIENYGIKLSGFHADTMHLARLFDSSRRADGGYSLEALSSDSRIICSEESPTVDDFNMGKISIKTIFGKKKVKKDGCEGKLITIAPMEVLQREERVPWICYSALDSISTLKLFVSLKKKLQAKEWNLDGETAGTMYDFYEKYWRPFGFLLVKMESEGMLVDRAYLSEVEKLAISEQKIAADRFRNWASKYCQDAKYMNVGSDTQLRQLFFGGTTNSKDLNESLDVSKTFKVLNTENVIEEGKKTPSKYRNITLHSLGVVMQTDKYTASGWPSVSGDVLKTFAGKVSTEHIYLMGDNGEVSPDHTLQDNEGGEATTVVSDKIDTSAYGTAYEAFGGDDEGMEACHAIAALCEVCSIDSLISNFILPLQGDHISGKSQRIHCSLNINTETGRLSARRPNLQNQPALEKDRYKIRQAFIAAPGNSLIVADYGQLELRILAHLANCHSMLDAFKAGGDFHSRTAMNMYDHVRSAVEEKKVLLEWSPQPGEDKPPVPLLKDAFASERRKAKMLNFSIAYGKTAHGLSRDWKVSLKEAKETVELWYKERQEVLNWQKKRKYEAKTFGCVHTLLGRARRFPSISTASNAQKGHIERAAINTPVQGSAADVAMCAMLEIDKNPDLKKLGWRLLLQVHDEVILEGPTESAEIAKAIVVKCMSEPFDGRNILNVDLAVDAKYAQSWYAAK